MDAIESNGPQIDFGRQHVVRQIHYFDYGQDYQINETQMFFTNFASTIPEPSTEEPPGDPTIPPNPIYDRSSTAGRQPFTQRRKNYIFILKA